MQEIKKWDSIKTDTQNRLKAAEAFVSQGKTVAADDIVSLLEEVIRPGDKVCVEGDNQKQADFLSESLNRVDPEKVHDLHMVQSVLALNSHLDLFDKGIARKLDFSFSGPQSVRLAQFVMENKIEIGAIHTYLELFGRYFVDLTPKVSLVAAYEADSHGNLYTGPNTEDTPIITEATKFGHGIVIAQVNKIVDKLPRVDIPGDWVDFIVESPQPFYLEPLFTRDPASISDTQVLMGMMAIKGIYAEYGIQRLNHGIGYYTSAIELLLPTYGEELGLKGKICSNFVLNPHPTLIPAIESGWVKTMHCFGGELGMEEYVRNRSDLFFTGPDGSLRSNRAYSQIAGHYSADMFIGGTLQIDKYGNSSTAVGNRITGFGGAPNMGCDSKGRRHTTEAWIKCGREYGLQEELTGNLPRGKKLVVQMQQTFQKNMVPTFVEKLSAWELAESCGMSIPPVMIYSDDVTHIVTEIGIAYLHKCKNMEQRMAAIRAVAGYTELGLQAIEKETTELRQKGIVKTPEDLGINVLKANRSMLAARNIRELVQWSGGLYSPPAKFRNW